jgi:hypothetical protein
LKIKSAIRGKLKFKKIFRKHFGRTKFSKDDEKKQKKLMSNSFHATTQFTRSRFMSDSNKEGREDSGFKITSISNLVGKEGDRQVEVPFYLHKDIYHPYRRLEDHHIADVLQEARKRHEQKLLNSKNEETKYTDIFFKAIDENNKVKTFDHCTF